MKNFAEKIGDLADHLDAKDAKDAKDAAIRVAVTRGWLMKLGFKPAVRGGVLMIRSHPIIVGSPAPDVTLEQALLIPAATDQSQEEMQP